MARSTNVQLHSYGGDEEFGYRDAEWVEEMYWGNGLSQAQIASVCGTDQSTVSMWMDRLGVDSKSPSHVASGEGNPNWSGVEVTFECDNCGESCERYRSKIDQYETGFCSNGCKSDYHSDRMYSGGRSLVEVDCAFCGDLVRRRPDRVEQYERAFCGVGCCSDYQEENSLWSGENSPRWRGGKARYYGPSWRSRRRKALRRDQHRCQWCGETPPESGRELDVHHIIPFRVFGVDRHLVANRLSNLTSLCRGCHAVIETEYCPVIQ